MVCDWLDLGASHTSAAHSFWMHSPKLTYDDAAELRVHRRRLALLTNQKPRRNTHEDQDQSRPGGRCRSGSHCRDGRSGGRCERRRVLTYHGPELPVTMLAQGGIVAPGGGYSYDDLASLGRDACYRCARGHRATTWPDGYRSLRRGPLSRALRGVGRSDRPVPRSIGHPYADCAGCDMKKLIGGGLMALAPRPGRRRTSPRRCGQRPGGLVLLGAWTTTTPRRPAAVRRRCWIRGGLQHPHHRHDHLRRHHQRVPPALPPAVMAVVNGSNGGGGQLRVKKS